MRESIDCVIRPADSLASSSVRRCIGLTLLLKGLHNVFELLRMCQYHHNQRRTVKPQYISDFTLLIDLLLQMLEDARVNASGEMSLGHRGAFTCARSTK
jgi:hypothetical protein